MLSSTIWFIDWQQNSKFTKHISPIFYYSINGCWNGFLIFKCRAVEQLVDPWKVQGAVVDGKPQPIDYNRLIEQFGTKAIDSALLERFERVTGHRPHRFLRRNIFFSHR
jgi:hypothetical protein